MTTSQDPEGRKSSLELTEVWPPRGEVQRLTEKQDQAGCLMKGDSFDGRKLGMTGVQKAKQVIEPRKETYYKSK